VALGSRSGRYHIRTLPNSATLTGNGYTAHMRFKFRVSAIFLSSLGVAACGSDSGPSPVDGGGRLDLQSQPSPSPLDAEWTLTDAGECMSPVWPPIYLACTLDEHPCGGISTCRSCNGALGLWRMMPVWPCACESATVNGATGLYWQCSSGGAVCQPGPGNFVDSQCTVPSVIDGGIDQAAEDSDGG